MQKIAMDVADTTGNQDSNYKPFNPRCATPVIDSIMANWKQEPNPYDDPAYQVPTCQRKKIIPEPPKKDIRCAAPAMDKILRLEQEYERLISAAELENLAQIPDD